ncbi:MAG: hypothetical protein FNP40_00305 [Dehalobacter sp. 4CP]|nr:hypothetical protein [Dehalobacter sp. 4CP]
MAGGMAAVTGHIWPVFFQFKGGKSVATALGVLSFVNPVFSCIYLFVLITILLKTRMISLGNICSALCLIVVNSTMSVAQRKEIGSLWDLWFMSSDWLYLRIAPISAVCCITKKAH